MDEKKLLHELEKIMKKHRNAKYKCSFAGCDQYSIKSHVLQKNGILKNIAEKQHVSQFSSKSLFNNDEGSRFEIRKVGINYVYTFPGFCKKHDSEIFSFIEDSNKYNKEWNVDAINARWIWFCDQVEKILEIDLSKIKLLLLEHDVHTKK